MKTTDIVAGFCPPQEQNINATLEELGRHIAPGEFAVVGGLAIRHHVIAHGEVFPERPFNDLDITVKYPDSVAPSITDTFRVAHFHNGPQQQDYYCQVAHPSSKIKVDIFAWPPYAPTVITAPWGDRSLPLLTVEDQAGKTIFDTTRVLRGGQVDPKQFEDARLLAPIADPQRMSDAFAEWYGSSSPTFHSAAAAFICASETARLHPEQIVPNLFGRQPTQPHCAVCIASPQFPLTPLDQIWNMMH